MDVSLDAVHSAFLQLDRRPAVFDREIREHVGQWTAPESVPASDIIARFKQNADFIFEDQKVILPLHEPDSADLTGEFLLYYPDHVVPCVVYHDFAKGDLARIPIEEFDTAYPAWRLRFWHPDFTPGSAPDYLVNNGDYTADPPSHSDSVTSAAPLPDNGEGLIADLREMITNQEIAERDEARNRCRTLPPAQFLTGRGGIEEVVTAGIEADEYGQQVVKLRIPSENLDGPVDVIDEYGLYPDSEVIVDSLDDLSGFPAEAEILGIEGRQVELAFYWDRGPDNPDPSVFELESDHRFLIGELLNPVPYDRKREAVDMISNSDRKRGWLSGSTSVGFEDGLDVSLSKNRLNKSQYQAAHNALTATDVFCIHGPPGTGKTRTLVEIIKVACENNQRVLAVSHSNQAVDNLLVGDSTSDRADPASIHGLTSNSDITAARAGGNSSNGLVNEEYVGEDLYQSDVVCATMSGAHRFGEDIFDLAVIDEATQASIPASLIPVTRAKRVVLAGDHKQLPPYHSGEHSENEDIAVSLFEHLVERYGDAIVSTLTTQYRMNEQIAEFPNTAFYGGELVHGQQNRTWSISTLPPLEGMQVEGTEEQTPSSSYYNEAEAAVVAEEVSTLLGAGVGPEDIGIITPYSGQIGKVRAELAKLKGSETDPVKIATVDSFQGSEREAIIVSFVRSNPQGFSGFLTFPNEGPRRLNVALTRARKRCVLVGNFDTLRTRAPTKNPAESAADVYQALYEHLDDRDLITQRG
jgi:hypothetical protein